MLRVRLLGGLALELDGRTIPPPAGRPARTLLAWLALHPGMHPRSRVAGQLWPNVLDESARNSLRTALGTLRRALGEGAKGLAATRDHVGLDRATWVDVVAFDQLVSAGRLDEALELCRLENDSARTPGSAELLPELDADWAYVARDEHRARLASVLARLADADEARGELELAVRRTRELVALEPLSEEAHRALIRRLGAAGDRSAALAAYERLRKRLREELRLAPSRETTELVEGLRDQHGWPEKGDEIALPPVLARAPRSPFVGRVRDLALLRAAWQLALGGQRQLMLVSGEAGIGKSRLAAELARSLQPSGATVLLGRAYEEPLVPYQPFVEALRPYLAGAAAETGELARLVLASDAGDDGVSFAAGDPAGARFQLFEGVSSVLAAAARARPVLLVLEDLHWADRPTLLLLAHLVRSPDSARLMVLGTYRPTDLGRAHPLAELLADLRRERLGERIALRGLSAGEVGSLVENWFGPGAPPGIGEAVHRETEGNPFFIEEMLRHLVESGATDDWGSDTLARIGVPEGVKEVIGRRLSRLSDDANQALTWAAVIGREFDRDLLHDLHGDFEGEPLAAALGEAEAAGMVREEPDSVGRYGFTHALTRETIYEELTAARRALLHGRVAEALERRYADHPERLGEVAHHLLQAAEHDRIDRAVEYAAAAAEQALGQLAYEEAAALLERALLALERVERPRVERRSELLLALGDARMRAGQTREGRRVFAEAAAVARSLGRSDLLGRAALGYGGIAVTIDAPDEDVVSLLEEALETLGDQEAGLRARLLARLAVELYYSGHRERTESLSDQAVMLARRLHDDSPLADALNSRHVAMWTADHLEERLRTANEMVELAQRTGDPVAELKGRNWRIVDLFEIGDIEALAPELDAYARLEEKVGLPAYRWYKPMWRATLAMLEGRLDEAKRLSSEALSMGRRTQDSNAEALLRPQLTYYLPLEEGRFDETDADYLRASIVKRPVGHAHRLGLVRVLVELDRTEEARHEFALLDAEGFAALPKDLHWLALLGELGPICAGLGDVHRAAEVYELYLPYARRNIINGRAIYCYGSTDHYLGLLAATASRWSTALEHFDAATALHRRLGARLHLCRTLCAGADVLVARAEGDDLERARTRAREAHDIASALGVGPLIETAATMLGPAR